MKQTTNLSQRLMSLWLKQKNKSIIIIGSGFAGLSAAAHLAKAGHKVQVFEKNEGPGGRASVWEKDGFRFDMGPSWYMMPEIFDEFFAKFGKKTSDYYDLEKLDPAYRIFFDENDVVDIFPGVDKNLSLFNELEENGDNKFKKYIKDVGKKYDLSLKYFTKISYDSFSTLLNPAFFLHGYKLDLLKSYDKFVSKYFKSKRARQILEYSIVFLGGSPNNTPALFSMISHADFNLGVWYPKGGINKVISGISDLCIELGVEFHFNSEVDKIYVTNKKAQGVYVNKVFYDADVVISGADYWHTETKLLDKENQAYSNKYWEKTTVAPSAFVVYLGINKKLKNIKHHNLILENDWMEHFNEIFDNPKWPDKPSYYVCAPSTTDNSVAPNGCENLFFTIPIAAGIEDTEEIREKYFNKIISHFEKITGNKFKDNIVVKRIFSIKDFSSRYNSYKGSALGLSQTLKQSAFFRPKHKSPKVDNLFYCGQYTHPGVGMAPCLISGEVVSGMV